MKTLIYLLTVTLYITPVQAATFDFPAVTVADIKAQWGDFDAPQVMKVPSALDGMAWSEAGFDAPNPKVVSGVIFPQGNAPRTGGSLIGSTFEWARNQQAAWGSGIPGLTASEGKAACGPIAAEALVRFFANNPSLNKITEIFNFAKNTGLWKGAMQGPEAERKLLAHYNIQVDNVIWVSNMSSGETQIVGSLRRGVPVIVSTNRHYFFVEGYNESSRQFFVGYTGRIMGNYGGTSQMTLSQISNAGGGGLALLIPR